MHRSDKVMLIINSISVKITQLYLEWVCLMPQEQTNFLLEAGQSALDYIVALDRDRVLTECDGCTDFFKRTTPGNLRDKIDGLVVNIFDGMSWDKSKPIELVDAMAGGLLQTATILVALVNAGYKVNLTLIDHAFKGDNPSLTQLRALIATINQKTNNPQSIQLKGVFSRVESYIATVQGIGPIQHERVSEVELRAGRAAGKSGRYFKLDLRSAAEKTQLKPKVNALSPNEIAENECFAKEFLASSNYQGTVPDLVLAIDDMTEISSAYLPNEHRAAFVEANGQSYMYRNEIYEPILALNNETRFIATQRQGKGQMPKVFVLNHTNKINGVYGELDALTPQSVAPEVASLSPEAAMSAEAPIISDATPTSARYATLDTLIGDFLKYCQQLPEDTENKQALINHAIDAKNAIDLPGNVCEMGAVRNHLNAARGLITHRNGVFVRCWAALANALIFCSVIGAIISYRNTGSVAFFGVFTTNREAKLDNIFKELPSLS